MDDLEGMVGKGHVSLGGLSKAKKGLYGFLNIALIYVIAACSNGGTATASPIVVDPTETESTIVTEVIDVPTINPTYTETPTVTPTPSPIPINYVTLGSPFAADCGDGIPRIWSNDSFNGPFKVELIDEHHGHVDIVVPNGCSPYILSGELTAPVDGILSQYELGFKLKMYSDEYPEGIEEALIFSGVQNPNLELISSITFDFGHVVNGKFGHVIQGQSIGDVDSSRPSTHVPAIGYQILIFYENVEYIFSPTLFKQDRDWICYDDSPYDCIAEQLDYKP